MNLKDAQVLCGTGPERENWSLLFPGMRLMN
jgi:hypothetical protein